MILNAIKQKTQKEKLHCSDFSLIVGNIFNIYNFILDTHSCAMTGSPLYRLSAMDMKSSAKIWRKGKTLCLWSKIIQSQRCLMTIFGCLWQEDLRRVTSPEYRDGRCVSPPCI